MRVLVAHDGGESGGRALAAIAAWVRESQAELHLLTVIQPGDVQDTPNPHGVRAITPAGTSGGQLLNTLEPFPGLAQSRSQAIDSARVETEERLRDAAATALGTYVVSVHVEFDDDTARAIVELSQRIEADVVAVGTHGRTGIPHAFLGSVAEQVMRTATIPVLVVGPHVNTG